MTTKDDVAKGFASIGGLIQNIGNTIKEQQRQKQVQKVLSQFKDPNKLFLNEDGTPKSDSEIAPMLNQGVMSLYQLGEDKLANSLTEYYSNMSKSFDKTSQNAFNYDVNSDDNLFPKTQDGQAIAFNERVDYGKFQGTKQYKPAEVKSMFHWDEVNMKGPDGSGTVKYIRTYKGNQPLTMPDGTIINPGQIDVMDESEYTKTIGENHNYTTFNNVSVGNQSFQKPDGTIVNTKVQGGKYYDPTTGAPVDIRGLVPIGENQSIPKPEQKMDELVNRVMGGLNINPEKKTDFDMYGQMYKNEINNWINGGTIPSFLTTDWIEKNPKVFNELVQLKKSKGQ